MESWPTEKLEEVADIIVGRTPARDDYLNEGIFKVLKYRDISQNKINWEINEKGFVKESRLNGLKEIREGDILITSAGHTPDKIGEDIAIVRTIPSKFQKVFFVSELICYRPKKSLLLSEWLLFFLNSKEGQEQIKKIVGDSVHLTGTKSKNLQIPLPSLSEQKRIVKKIEKLFGKIDEAEKLRKEAIEDTENLLKSAIQEVFEGREAKGWPTKKLGEVTKIFAGSSAPQDPKYFLNGKYPFFRVSDLNSQKIENLIHSRDYINDLAVKELRLVMAPRYSIVFPKSGAAILTNSRGILGVNGYIVSHLAAIEADRKQVLPKWVYLFLCMFDMSVLVKDRSYPSLKLSEIGEIKIPLPPLSQQKQIVACLDSLSEKIRRLKELQNQTAHEISQLRQSILDKAFKGELK